MKIKDAEEDLDDLTGCLFGDLKVLRRIPDHFECGCRRWRCMCSCGNAVETFETALLENRKTSCGCQDQIRRLPIRRTRIDYDGEPVTA
jgi:hypothetical protein